MTAITSQIVLAAPELGLLVLASVLLVIDTVFSDSEHRVTYWLAQGILLLTALTVFYQFPHTSVVTLAGHYVSDPMAAVLKIVICVTTIAVFIYAREFLREHGLARGEFYILGMFAVLGMMVMVSAYSLLAVYLGLELLSLSLYSMVAMHRDSSQASEAAMKYFVLGALASGMLLYGMSMLYGVTGTLTLSELSMFVAVNAGSNLLLTFGLVFMLVGTLALATTAVMIRWPLVVVEAGFFTAPLPGIRVSATSGITGPGVGDQHP